VHIAATARERQRGGQATDAATDNETGHFMQSHNAPS
jgi:hypothetical protein